MISRGRAGFVPDPACPSHDRLESVARIRVNPYANSRTEGLPNLLTQGVPDMRRVRLNPTTPSTRAAASLCLGGDVLTVVLAGSPHRHRSNAHRA